jgi:hypothetical protein
VKGDSELACTWVAGVEKSSPDASVSADRSILHPLQVSLRLKEQRKTRLCIPGFL